MYDVIIIGAGAAGLMAAVSATANGFKVLVLEKMAYAGKKMLITGKGRCNITNACDYQEFIKNIPVNGRFFNSSFSRFSNHDTVEWFNNQGLPTKVERGMRVFPESDKAMDVRDTLVKYILRQGGRIEYNTSVKELLTTDGGITGVRLFSGKTIAAPRVIVATGGASYRTTGSDGYGYQLAESVGHTVEQIYPALVPLNCEFAYKDELQGLSLKNVKAKLFNNNKLVAEEFGEMLFAHFGLTGPIILSLSGAAAKLLQTAGNKPEIVLDLKPALDPKQLKARLDRELEANTKKQLGVVLRTMLPSSIINTVLDAAFVEPTKQSSQLTKQERQSLLTTIKHLPFAIEGTRDINEAIVTAGGIRVKEINPKTMQSKLVKGLYFAGEIIDISAYTGGFNLQIAFSTGYAAGLLQE